MVEFGVLLLPVAIQRLLLLLFVVVAVAGGSVSVTVVCDAVSSRSVAADAVAFVILLVQELIVLKWHVLLYLQFCEFLLLPRSGSVTALVLLLLISAVVSVVFCIDVCSCAAAFFSASMQLNSSDSFPISLDTIAFHDRGFIEGVLSHLCSHSCL